jgi:hypothetical protein
MTDLSYFFLDLLRAGLGNLGISAAHVLLCLLPAFYIAGAMTALIPADHPAFYRTLRNCFTLPQWQALCYSLFLHDCSPCQSIKGREFPVLHSCSCAGGNVLH